MPQIISISTVDFPYRLQQNELKQFARNIFTSNYSDIERLLESFDNSQIKKRNLCVPMDFFYSKKTFKEKNNLFIKYSVEYSVKAIEECILNSGLDKEKITDIVFISTTGISTPSIDALIINKMKLNSDINRTPVWGLGCAGGSAGIARANVIAKANPEAVVLVIAVELCSLTFILNDLSKSNLIATALFSDGVGAVLVKGDDVSHRKQNYELSVRISDAQSQFYYDTLDVMGWEILDEGFKVLFSRDIPSIVLKNIRSSVDCFLRKNNLNLSDIKNFIAHPGGIKVINAYIESLGVKPELFNNTKKVLREYGNMSSVTVLYVLKEFFESKSEGGFEKGSGLMMSLGPGFSSEMVLLEIEL